jgi:serine/threonine-protein phosphatase PGAM5
LLLIRHGQYNLDGKCDEEKKLTQLGRDQASLTGRRLKELGLPWSKVIVSTMTRAKETKELICSELKLAEDVTMETPDDILREGAPIRPEPDVVRKGFISLRRGF